MYTRRARWTLGDEIRGRLAGAFDERGRTFGWEWNVRRVRQRHWTPGRVILALILSALVLALICTLLVLALAGAVLAAPIYLGYRILRAQQRSRRRAPAGADPRRLARDARGLLEMARTPDPLDRYLLAVREFDRISASVLALDPADLLQRRVNRRASDLAEQAYNLHDAVTEIERQLAGDPAAAGALANVWELSVAAGELWSYCRDLTEAPRSPSLAAMRAFVARRTALLSRRDALVVRLREADLRRPAPAPPGLDGSPRDG
jgi:hypothetical protein